MDRFRRNLATRCIEGKNGFPPSRDLQFWVPLTEAERPALYNRIPLWAVSANISVPRQDRQFLRFPPDAR
jgi:hypothetical protein